MSAADKQAFRLGRLGRTVTTTPAKPMIVGVGATIRANDMIEMYEKLRAMDKHRGIAVISPLPRIEPLPHIEPVITPWPLMNWIRTQALIMPRQQPIVAPIDTLDRTQYTLNVFKHKIVWNADGKVIVERK